MFHSSVHLTPHPYPVGKHQHKQGDKEPQDDTQRRHHPRCRLQTPQFTVFQRHIQVLFFRKVITTPFIIHCTLFQQYQPGIGAHNGFQRDFIRYAKRIIRPRQVLPSPNHVITGCRQTIKGIPMFAAIVIKFIDTVYIAVVRKLQIRRD